MESKIIYKSILTILNKNNNAVDRIDRNIDANSYNN